MWRSEQPRLVQSEDAHPARGGRLAFEELFEGASTTFDLVITFLALLEMTRLRMTRLFQADIHSTIYIEFTVQVASEGEPSDGEHEEGAPDTLAPLPDDAGDPPEGSAP